MNCYIFLISYFVIIINNTNAINIITKKRVIIAGKVSCDFKASKNTDVQLWEIDKSFASDVEMTTNTDYDGNFYIDKIIQDYFSSDLELVIKIFHQCNIKDTNLCYKVVEIPVPTTFFEYNESDDETYTPRAYNLGTIELDTNHPLQGISCSHLLGSTINRYIDFGSKFFT